MSVSYALAGTVNLTTLGFTVQSCRFSPEGDYVYVAGVGNDSVTRVVTVDVTDPTTPTIVHTLTVTVTGTGGINRGAAVDGDYLYLGSVVTSGAMGKILVVDISTRSAPTQGTSFDVATNYNARALHAPGDGYLYASVRERVGGAVARLYVYSASGTSAPSLAGNLALALANDIADAHGLSVGGDRAILATNNSASPKLILFDVTTRTAPTQLDSVARSSTNLLEQSAVDAAGTVGWYSVGNSGPATGATIDLDSTVTSLDSLTLDGGGQVLLGRSAFWDDRGYVVVPAYGVVDVRDPANVAIAAIATGSFTSDWAADYHPATGLTATSDEDGTNNPLSIGLVEGIAVPVPGSLWSRWW